MIDPSTNSIFIHIPKTAGSSVCDALYGNRSVHRTALSYKDLYPEEYNTFFKFAFVRNPWDRAVSYYLMVVRYRHAHSVFADIADTCEHLFGDFEFGSFVNFIAVAHFRGLSEDLDNSSYRGDYSQTDVRLTATISQELFPQYFWTHVDRRNDLDFLGRWENLEEDFNYVCKALKIEYAHLGRLMSSIDRDHYSDYYTDNSIDMIGDLFSKDIEVFDYKFEKS